MQLSCKKQFLFSSKNIMAALFTVIAGALVISVYFYQLSEKLVIQIEDKRGNNILIKENNIYECLEELYFVLPSEDDSYCQVSVNNSFYMNMTHDRYCFRIENTGRRDKVYKVTFRQIQPNSFTVKKQIFYLKYSSSIYENPNM